MNRQLSMKTSPHRPRGLRTIALVVCLAGFGALTPLRAEVLGVQKISDIEGGLPPGLLSAGDQFGAPELIDDLDGNGVCELAVGVNDHVVGGSTVGAVYILFMNADHTVASHTLVSQGSGGLQATLANLDSFGKSVTHLGDLDGDGDSATAIAVGAIGDNTGGPDRGAVYILFLNTDGTVATEHKIAEDGSSWLVDSDEFGSSIASLGDIDGTGHAIAVGARGDTGSTGAVWILYLNDDGTVFGAPGSPKRHRIAPGIGLLDPMDFDPLDFFGISVASLGDFDGPEGTPVAIAVGASQDDGTMAHALEDSGAVWILWLNGDGTVATAKPIRSPEVGGLEEGDLFGDSVAMLGDLDGNGVPDLAVGDCGDDDGGEKTGAVRLLLLDSSGSVIGQLKISAIEGNFPGDLDPDDGFCKVGSAKDLDGDGRLELPVGAPGDDDDSSMSGQLNKGAVWILTLDLVCMPGTVDATATGAPRDILFVNGSAGGLDRTVVAEAGDLVWGTILDPPSSVNGKFVIHANLGDRDDMMLTPIPQSIGTFCFRAFLGQSANPKAVWNNIGKEDKVGSSVYFGTPLEDPARASTVFLTLYNGDLVNLGPGTTLTFQGIITDGASASTKRASVTNATILSIQ